MQLKTLLNFQNLLSFGFERLPKIYYLCEWKKMEQILKQSLF